MAVAALATASCEFAAKLGLTEFCGSSTAGHCTADEDCFAGGCSGQVCQTRGGEPAETTCEWRECYDDDLHDVECGCVENQCKWRDG